MRPAEPELSCSALKMHVLGSTSQLWEPSGIQIGETDEGTNLGKEVAMVSMNLGCMEREPGLHTQGASAM